MTSPQPAATAFAASLLLDAPWVVNAHHQPRYQKIIFFSKKTSDLSRRKGGRFVSFFLATNAG